MTGLLEGKVAIVTGAGRGIGAATAARFASAGATVVVSDINGDAANQVAASLPNGRAVVCDVTDEQQVSALVETTVEQCGRLDVMVNNAGIVGISPVVETDYADWRRVLAVDLDGVFLGIKHAAPAMAASGGGSIINIASVKAFGAMPGAGSYNASKAAVVSLSKTAALELRGANVRVNALCPGWLETDLIHENGAKLEKLTGVNLQEYIGHIQGRWGETDEIAAVALFLASDRSRLINAAAIVADGGAMSSLL